MAVAANLAEEIAEANLAECFDTMSRDVLLLNAGSSSLKGGCYDLSSGRLRASGQAEWAGEQTRFRWVVGEANRREHNPWEKVPWRGHAAAAGALLQRLQSAGWNLESDLVCIGHRIVHGADFSGVTRIGPEVRSRIERLVQLAPLHNGPCLEALGAVEHKLPGTPQLAVFDSGFHATIPEAARTYALPWQWTSEWGIRRFGFHGLSHQYCSRRAAEWFAERGLATDQDKLRIIVCHLGHGCSLAAVQGGTSRDTTMGFTPLEGLVMATRSGSIDPGIIPFLQRQHGLTPEEIEHALNRESGLKGVSGLSGDLRELQLAAESGHERARLAIAIYIHSIRSRIGAMAASLGGLDALVFTAGVGENSPRVRAEVCLSLGFLGIKLDAGANESCEADAEISSKGSPAKVLVIATREEQEMFRQVRERLGANST